MSHASCLPDTVLNRNLLWIYFEKSYICHRHTSEKKFQTLRRILIEALSLLQALMPGVSELVNQENHIMRVFTMTDLTGQTESLMKKTLLFGPLNQYYRNVTTFRWNFQTKSKKTLIKMDQSIFWPTNYDRS